MRELYADDYYRLAVDERGIVHLTRSSKVAEDLQAFSSCLENVEAAVERELGPGGRGPGILIDSRDVRARNDEAFEEGTRAYRQKIREAFERTAVLVRTEIGKLHIARLNRDDGTNTRTFSDMDEALAYLTDTRT